MLLKLKGLLETKDGVIEGIASTDTADRDGDIIKQDGWDLKSFKKNPVILASHNYHEFPIGMAKSIKVDGNKLTFKMVFSEATEMAKQASQLVQEGILKAFSVGFIPREYDEKSQNIITKAELLEISLVSVPSNPQAIVVAKEFKDNKLATHLVKEWLLDEKMKKQVKEIEDGEIEEELEELDKEVNKKTKKIKKASGDGNIESSEESRIIEADVLDVKLLQKTTGYLQTLLHEIKKGGAKNE